jgi:hypothetical protein
MATWSATARLDKNSPSVRIIPDLAGTGTNLIDWWDETYRRYKSGVVKVTVTSIALSDAAAGPSGNPYYAGSGGANYASGETLAVAIQPPNFNALNDTQYLNSGVAVAAGTILSGSPLYENVCAVNYGRPGPSATLGPDGTIQFTAIDLALASNALTDIQSAFTVTVSGTLTQTIISPYADIGGTAYAIGLCNGPLAAQRFQSFPYRGQWGMIAYPAAAGYASVAVQLQKVTSVYFPGVAPDALGPALTVSNPAQAGGQTIANLNLTLPMAGLQTNNLADNFTCIYALNNGLIDANGVRLTSADLGLDGNIAYNLLNCGLDLPNGSQGSAAAVLNYKIAEASL